MTRCRNGARRWRKPPERHTCTSVKPFALALLVLAVSGCRHAPPYDYSREPDPRGREFVVGPADVLRIHVWRDQELTTEVPVRPDGTFTMPLLGDLRAAGRTPSEIRTDIGDRLSKYFKDSVVTVSVVTVNSYRFTVSGNVLKPGIYTAANYLTVMEVVALAGGVTRFADLNGAVVIRRDDKGQTRRIPVDLAAVENGGAPYQNVVVLSGDVVYMP